jgi:hypothetical protein
MADQATNSKTWKKLHDLAGVLIKDVWRYGPALWSSPPDQGTDGHWIYLKNRIEVLQRNPHGRGVHCDWTWTSDLHACNVIPAFGRRLLQLALQQWPISFAEAPLSSAGPKISFLFAHEGTDRLPHLQHVIGTIFAQRNVQVEIVVVDLSQSPVGAQLPANVVYKHIDTSGITPGWRKAWAFNIAARCANGEFLVCHDGDVCIPDMYGSELMKAFRLGYDAVSIQRFLFYLNQSTTQHVFQDKKIPVAFPPARVLQNFKGGTIAVTREHFFDIGGFDEGFVDWGGEDDEFYNRCGARQHLRFGFLPFVHLWHAPQHDRIKPDNLNVSLVLPRRLAIPAAERISELYARDFGNIQKPDPIIAYKTQFAKPPVGVSCSP